MDIHPTFGTSPSVVEVVQMQRPFLSVFSIHPVYDAIFSQADELAIVRFRRTCHPARFAVDDYLVRACNIDKHLSRFFTDTKAFRNLQAQTATVISGSTALQLFLRTTYPGSDLDLYVYPSKAREIGNWLLAAEGYEYVPPSEADHWAASFQKATDEHGELYATLMLLDDDEIVADGEAGDDYSSSAAEIKIVFKFQKVIHGTLDTLRVQMIVCKFSPFETILAFHSTCVLNIVTYNAAYSLYPRATFGEKISLALKSDGHQDALAKYTRRGFNIQHLPHVHHALRRSDSIFHYDKCRWVDDSYSWIVRLDVQGVASSPDLTSTSTPLEVDPSAHNGWILHAPHQGSASIRCYRLYSPLFHFAYVMSDDISFEGALKEFFSDGRQTEYVNILDSLSESANICPMKDGAEELSYVRREEDAWRKWWDGEMPLIRKRMRE